MINSTAAAPNSSNTKVNSWQQSESSTWYLHFIHDWSSSVQTNCGVTTIAPCVGKVAVLPGTVMVRNYKNSSVCCNYGKVGHGVMLYDMVQRNFIWYGTTQFCMIWYNAILYDMLQHNEWYGIYNCMIWHNTIFCTVVKHNVVWYGTMQCCTIWDSAMLYDFIQGNVVQYGTTQCCRIWYNDGGRVVRNGLRVRRCLLVFTKGPTTTATTR